MSEASGKPAVKKTGATVISHANGAAGRDVIHVESAPSFIESGEGNDTVRGFNSSVEVHSKGNDSIDGIPGNKTGAPVSGGGKYTFEAIHGRKDASVIIFDVNDVLVITPGGRNATDPIDTDKNLKFTTNEVNGFFDKNADGNISGEELKEGLKKLGVKLMNHGMELSASDLDHAQIELKQDVRSEIHISLSKNIR